MEREELLKLFKEHKTIPDKNIKTAKGTDFSYEYIIFPLADINAFYKHCFALLKYIEGIKTVGKIVEDIDGSLVQCFMLNGKELRVYLDQDYNEIFDLSEFDIRPYGFGE